MMKVVRLFAILFNLPYTLIGLFLALLSPPRSINIHAKPFALVIHVRSFWWLGWMSGRKGLRATTVGNVVLLSPKLLTNDLKHELIHIEQSNREPLLHPFLYFWESFRHDYRQNKYEVEAYEKAGNEYVEASTDMRHILYFNGLGYGKLRKRERLAIRYLNKHNIQVTHAQIDWYADESFTDLFDRMTALTKQQLKEHGALTLVGSSAGGSLALNILGEVHSPNLTSITLCSRLHEAPLKWWDKRSLPRMAHIGAENSSRAFFNSVTYCGDVIIPKLTIKDKQRLILVQQWADFVVPRPTMSIDGVRIYKVAALGHGWGIAMGVRQLPKIVRLFDV